MYNLCMLTINDIAERGTSWIHKDLELRQSPIHGYGLFASKEIPVNTLVAVFGGKVYTAEEISNLPDDSFVKDVATQLNNDFFLGPLNENDVERGFFINHRCEPNARIKNSIFLVTIKSLVPDEELTFDYAHSHNKQINMQCSCGAKSCRKIIRNDDYLNPEYASKNMEYFVEWLRELVVKQQPLL